MVDNKVVITIIFSCLVVNIFSATAEFNAAIDPSHICTEGSCHYSNSNGRTKFAACPGGQYTYIHIHGYTKM